MPIGALWHWVGWGASWAWSASPCPQAAAAPDWWSSQARSLLGLPEWPHVKVSCVRLTAAWAHGPRQAPLVSRLLPILGARLGLCVAELVINSS